MKTIKQIADELGVSKQAVQKRISREPLYTSLYPYIHTNNNTKYIDESGENLIKSAFDKSQSTTPHIDVADNQSVTNDNQVTALIEMLQHELELKDNLIVNLSKQNQLQAQNIETLTAALENTTESLKSAHALHAGTIKQQSLLEAPPAEASAEPDKRGGFFGWLGIKK